MNIKYRLLRFRNKKVYDNLKILDDFCIQITPSIVNRLLELYPNEIAMENYKHSFILNYLDELEGFK